MKRVGLICVLSAGTAWAQQAADPSRQADLQAERDAAALQEQFRIFRADQAAYQLRMEELLKARQGANQTADARAQAQAARAQLRAMQTRIAATQALMDELLKTRQASHPDILALRMKIDELRVQEAALELGARRLTTGGALQAGPDRWWKNPATAQSLGLTADQQKKMDDVFQQYRLKLIDLNAALEKDEVTLEPLVAAGPLDESRITEQIDRVAQARAELEKANGRMLLGIRKQLTPEQWSKLNQTSTAPAQK